ncbi:MAG: hypothetical protein SV775_05490 [Thermodesulfobacteriota bacterium]|nr:hypothetical protein [Thermodesulfobacteriota bacterium]
MKHDKPLLVCFPKYRSGILLLRNSIKKPYMNPSSVKPSERISKSHGNVSPQKPQRGRRDPYVPLDRRTSHDFLRSYSRILQLVKNIDMYGGLAILPHTGNNGMI